MILPANRRRISAADEEQQRRHRPWSSLDFTRRAPCSLYPQKDICAANTDVRFGPIADMSSRLVVHGVSTSSRLRPSGISPASRASIAVTAAPRALTIAIIISTAVTPPYAFTCGSTKTPNVAPTLAEAAAKPPADARILVGNNSGARAKVVAL